MYKLVCGICALVIGLLLFGAYSAVFASAWYANYSEQLLQGCLNLFPSFLQHLNSNHWIGMTTLMSLCQSVVLSLVFAMIFGVILGVFTGLISVAQYALLGALFGFLYAVVPSLMVFVDEQLFAGTLNLPILSQHQLVEVLSWYLPLMIGFFYIVASKRKKHARTERFWFRESI
ncbi:hypothetical protein [Vibrio taketomensis]|uniref:hypothetical protein n=1 Tax=Vibrio taketomensis TaxID=2572923 RepID=UPI001389FF75|nr:hypothetical protein [Vibrio taketomensis]